MRVYKPKHVAERLGITTRTLLTWRKDGKGPRFIEIEGHPRCREDDLNKYIDDNTPDDSADEPESINTEVCE